TSSIDGVVKVWDVWRDQEARAIWVPRMPPSANLAYSPDGRHIAAAGTNAGTGTETVSDVQVFDVASGTVRLSLKGHERGVTGVVYSPDGRRLTTASLDGTVRRWNAATGQEVSRLEAGDTKPITALASSPDGRRLATASQDRTIRVWDADSDQLLGVLS